jgi:hypothetical protein
MFEAFKKELFRPIVTLLFPSMIALWPFVFFVLKKHPNLLCFIQENKWLIIFLSTVLLAGLGLLLEDFGGLIESKMNKNQKLKYKKTFNEFLCESYKIEPIGMRYIDSLTIRMKFELGFAVSMIVAILGVILLYFFLKPFSLWIFLIILILKALLIVYLLCEAKYSFLHRSEYRKILIDHSKSKLKN